jgi:hypothetical protein
MPSAAVLPDRSKHIKIYLLGTDILKNSSDAMRMIVCWLV